MIKVIRLGLGIVLALFIVGFVLAHGLHGSIDALESLSKTVYHWIAGMTRSGKPQVMAGQ